MTRTHTVGELVEALSEYDDEMDVRVLDRGELMLPIVLTHDDHVVL